MNFERCFNDLSDFSDLEQAKLLMRRISNRVGNGIRLVANSAREEREALEHHIRLQDERA